MVEYIVLNLHVVAVSGSCVLDEESQLIFHCNRSIGNLLLNDCNNIQTYASCPSITVTCTDDVPLKCHCFKSETQNNNSCSKGMYVCIFLPQKYL